MKKIIEKATKIQCLICDLDGVLTDGLLYFDHEGHELKSFHVHDGVGLKLLMAANIEVAVITTSRNAMIEHRMQQLGIRHYFMGQLDKNKAYQELKSRLNLSDDAFAYIGDDLPDIPIIRQVGLGVAVANAQPSVKEIACWSTQLPGGHGAVRELCDLLLTAQNKQDMALKQYLSQKSVI
jgi:3-deoxy-D-manno-octulosonate 8-phosphate phosphatase (KDO 8-P phosphatase)